jgi:hypothetical protein
MARRIQRREPTVDGTGHRMYLTDTSATVAIIINLEHVHSLPLECGKLGCTGAKSTLCAHKLCAHMASTTCNSTIYSSNIVYHMVSVPRTEVWRSIYEMSKRGLGVGQTSNLDESHKMARMPKSPSRAKLLRRTGLPQIDFNQGCRQCCFSCIPDTLVFLLWIPDFTGPKARPGANFSACKYLVQSMVATVRSGGDLSSSVRNE